MNNHPFHYHQPFPRIPYYPVYPLHHPYLRPYPPVDTKQFEQSVKSFHLLFNQGNLLLTKLADKGFAAKLMEAAQQGNQTKVDSLLKTVGLRVPVETKYSPSGVNFILSSPPNQTTPTSCCSLSLNLKWGQ